MLLYDVKLINPQTKEIYFQSLSIRPELPSEELIKKHIGAILIISTCDSPSVATTSKAS